MSPSTDPQALVVEFFEKVWRPPHDLSAIDRLMTEDYRITSAGIVIQRRAAFKEWIADFHRKLPEATNEILDWFASPAGNRIAARWRCTGINRGLFRALNSDVPITFTGIALWRISGNRLAECWVERSSARTILESEEPPEPYRS